MNAAAAREIQRAHFVTELAGSIGDAAEFAYDYLDSYGYVETLSNLKVEEVAAAITAGVTAFQRVFGGALKVDGVIGPKTLRAMELPRCGCSDAPRLAGSIGKWARREVTYGWASYLPQISVADQKNIWESLITAPWEAVIDFKFRPANVGERPNLLIHAHSLRRDGFGRAGGVLADQELPPPDFDGQLNMRFDLAEPWKVDRSRAGIAYGTVGVHELGHFLGIDHNPAGTGIMAAFYNESIDKPQDGYDKDQAILRYGPAKASAPTNPVGEETELTIGGVKYRGHLAKVA